MIFAIGRFINADALASTGQGILGNNMFAYCNNNAVNLVDTTGTLPFGIGPMTVAINDGGEGDGRRWRPSAMKSPPYIPEKYDDSLIKNIKNTHNAAVMWIENNGETIYDVFNWTYSTVSILLTVGSYVANYFGFAFPVPAIVIYVLDGIAVIIWTKDTFDLFLSE